MNHFFICWCMCFFFFVFFVFYAMSTDPMKKFPFTFMLFKLFKKVKPFFTVNPVASI